MAPILIPQASRTVEARYLDAMRPANLILEISQTALRGKELQAPKEPSKPTQSIAYRLQKKR